MPALSTAGVGESVAAGGRVEPAVGSGATGYSENWLALEDRDFVQGNAKFGDW